MFLKRIISSLALLSLIIYWTSNLIPKIINNNLIISWNQCEKLYIDNKLSNHLIVYEDYALIKSLNNTITYQINIPYENYIEQQILAKNNFNIFKLFNNKISNLDIIYYKYDMLIFIVNNFLSIFIILFLLVKNLNKNLSSIGGSLLDFNVLIEKNKSVKLDDVGGSFNSKKELLDIVNIFKNYEQFSKLGGRSPKGVLLEGPPGTGKTLISRAIANELDMTFIILSGSDLIKPIVGVGTMFIKEVFKKARENKPCIIFIDEIDAVGKSRDNGSHGLNERDNILNSLLVQMDGFEQNSQILVLGATNRADILDKALLRPGRFDRIVKFSLPNFNERIDIFKKYMNKYLIDIEQFDDKFINNVCHQTFSFSGADIENLFLQSSIETINNNQDKISSQSLIEAIDFVQLGSIVQNLLSPLEKKIIAIHESGHAIIAYHLSCNPEYVTIVPRSKGTLGFTKIIPENDQVLNTYQDFFNQICILLGGRYAEQILLNKVTEGASDDLNKATKIANQMVKKFAMKSPDIIDKNQNLLINENNFYNENSQLLIEDFDKNVLEILGNAQIKTKEIIMNYKDKINLMADNLIQKNSINKTEILKILE